MRGFLYAVNPALAVLPVLPYRTAQQGPRVREIPHAPAVCAPSLESWQKNSII
jgi:hypothetical protein